MKKIIFVYLFICLAFKVESQIACFAPETSYANTSGSFPYTIQSSDFNEDGKPDIATANYGTNTVSIRLGNGLGAFGSEFTFASSTQPSGITCNDFNGDGHTDIACANYGSNNVSLLLGNGLGSFSSASNFVTGTQPSFIISGDFNGDNNKDIITTNEGSNNVAVLLGLGNGTFSAVTYFSTGTAPEGVVAADYNSDGFLDLAVANNSSNNISILLGNGSGIFGAPTNYSVTGGPWAITSADLNVDGKSDLVVVRSTNNNVAVLLNSGTGSFGTLTNYAALLTGSIYSVTTAELNGDGIIDIVVPCDNNRMDVFAGTGAGNFAAAYTINIGGASGANTSIACIDLNGDLRKDFIVTNVPNTIGVLLTAAAPTITITGNLEVCSNNNTAYLSGSGVATYTWSPNAGGVNTNTVIINPTSNTTYTLSGQPSNKMCTSSSVATVSVTATPTITINSVAPICPSVNVVLQGQSASTYAWSANAGNATTNTVTVNPTSTTTYTLVGQNSICASSATITVNVVNTPTPDICTVTVDDPGNNNVIYWDKTNYLMADTFFVYREITNGNYSIIGKVPSDSLSMFVDTVRTLYFPNTGNPRDFSFKYKLAIKDTCGNLSGMSLYHGTMFLQDQLNGNFNWTHYEIEGQSTPVPTLLNYRFLRDNDYNGVFETTIGTTTSNLATDSQYFIHQNTADWRIETDWTISCNPTLRLAGGQDIQTVVVRSKSNIKNNRTVGIKDGKNQEVRLKVYPNPATNMLNVEVSLLNENEAIIIIENMLGQIVFTVKTTQQLNEFNISTFNSGVYFVKVKANNTINSSKLIIQK